jgi:hypothetical protein
MINYSYDSEWLTLFQLLISNIIVASFIGGGNRSIKSKTPTCGKSLTNFITLTCNEYTSPLVGIEVTTLGDMH